MADPRDQSGDRSNERMGRGVKEGLNAGQSRNAHDSGSRAAGSTNAGASGASGGMQDESSDRGRGGYGDDSGFTGGSRSADDGAGRSGAGGASGAGRSTSGRTTGDEGEAALEHNSPRAAAPGSEGANVEDHSRIDGVGHQAPSGMEERESSGESR